MVINNGSTPVTDVSVQLSSAEMPPLVRISGGVTRVFEVTPGDWDLLISSETCGMSEHAILVTPDQAGVQVIEVTLTLPGKHDACLRVCLRNEDCGLIASADVWVDGWNLQVQHLEDRRAAHPPIGEGEMMCRGPDSFGDHHVLAVVWTLAAMCCNCG